MARFSFFHEQTFRRHFRKAFRWVWFNLTVFRLRRHPEEPIVGVFDCSFLPKSGTKTWGIDRFFSSLAGRSKEGLEVSVLGIVATGSRRAFGVDATLWVRSSYRAPDRSRWRGANHPCLNRYQSACRGGRKAECSPRTYRREAYNRLLIGRLFSKLDLSAEYDRITGSIGGPHRTHGRLRSISDFSTCTDYWQLKSTNALHRRQLPFCWTREASTFAVYRL